MLRIFSPFSTEFTVHVVGSRAIILELCLIIKLGSFLILTELQELCLNKTDEMPWKVDRKMWGKRIIIQANCQAQTERSHKTREEENQRKVTLAKGSNFWMKHLTQILLLIIKETMHCSRQK